MTFKNTSILIACEQKFARGSQDGQLSTCHYRLRHFINCMSSQKPKTVKMGIPFISLFISEGMMQYFFFSF